MKAYVAALAALAFTACADLRRHGSTGAPPAEVHCRAWLMALDARIDAAGVRDAEDTPVEGFAGLRVNRLLVALAGRARDSDAAWQAWLQHAQSLDAAARPFEIDHLLHDPSDAASKLGNHERFAACSDLLSTALRTDAAARAEVLQRAQVPDRYSEGARLVGLYALTRLPFFAGVQAWQREHEQAMREAAAAPRKALRWVPDTVPAPAPPIQLQTDALGLPQLTAAQAEQLLANHAPVFEVETEGPFDAIGAPVWRVDGRVEIDTRQPVVYQRLTHTLVGGQALLQLVYSAWFPERPRRGPFDLLGGALDSVIVRLTLGPEGTVRMLDTIHACGCYHLFFPGHGVAPRPGAPRNQEWAFVPARLPDVAAGQRLVVRLASATHYVLGVSAESTAIASGTRYLRRPEHELRRLPLPGGGTRSLYGPDGLVAGSERGERFFFWPMGIASAGAMRQWGHHATAFVGRRHFDDADLLDLRFEFSLAK